MNHSIRIILVFGVILSVGYDSFSIVRSSGISARGNRNVSRSRSTGLNRTIHRNVGLGKQRNLASRGSLAGRRSTVTNRINRNNIFNVRSTNIRSNSRIQQRNFMRNVYNGHNWRWWRANNPSFFYTYFPAAFYASYGYYPPVYYGEDIEDGEEVGVGVSQDIYPELMVEPTYRDCVQKCLTTTTFDVGQCTGLCSQI